MNVLKNLFLNALAECYDGEKRLVATLPRLAKSAASKDLRELLQRHRKESVGHVKKLEGVFTSFAVVVKTAKSTVTISLLEDCAKISAKYKGTPALNAALVCCVQRIEHLEIASYGCLAEWAAILGNKIACSLLRDILAEERAADQALNYFARTAANPEALDECVIASGGSKAGVTSQSSVSRRVGLRPRTFNRIHPLLM